MYDDDNWLHAGFVNCPQCRTRLYRLDRSPMADDHHFYCDRCAHSVEIGYYDPVYHEIFTALRQNGDKSFLALMQAIEKHLRPCDCGGQYKHDAPRRCYVCLSPVLTADVSGVDLWPEVWGVDVDARDPTAEEMTFVERFEDDYIRKRDIWT
jgi:hypothetical protein